MISQIVPINVPAFASSGSRVIPDGITYANGYVSPVELPAEHLNWFLNGLTTNGVTEQAAINSLITQVNGLTAPTVLSSGSPYSVTAVTGYYVVTVQPYTLNLPAASGSGIRIRFINGNAGAGLITITPSGTDKIGPAGNVSCFLQNVDGSCQTNVQWIELSDAEAGLWEVTGGHYCPHQTVDTDGSQYYLGKFHHLPLGNTTSRAIGGAIVFSGTGWKSAVTAAGAVGVPAGAKAILAKIYLAIQTTAVSGSWFASLGFSDNNSNIPNAGTAHPWVTCCGYNPAAAAVNYYPGTPEVVIPLNSSGQFYPYLNLSGGGVIDTSNAYFTVNVVGYYMGD